MIIIINILIISRQAILILHISGVAAMQNENTVIVCTRVH